MLQLAVNAVCHLFRMNRHTLHISEEGIQSGNLKQCTVTQEISVKVDRQTLESKQHGDCFPSGCGLFRNIKKQCQNDTLKLVNMEKTYDSYIPRERQPIAKILLTGFLVLLALVATIWFFPFPVSSPKPCSSQPTDVMAVSVHLLYCS